MLELFLAVVVASLFGSLHCVGMCGPFVMLAMGKNTTTNHDGTTVGIGKVQRMFRLSAYHSGRLITYILLGILVGLVGAAANKSGSLLGFGNMAARFVGVVMLVLGAWRLYQYAFHSEQTVAHTPFFAAWTKSLISLKKRFSFQSPLATSFSWGLISTWLPCGWLYVFALAAAASGGPVRAASLMIAFWIGTLPLLSFVAVGITAFGKNATKYLHPFSAVLLIVFGVYTSSSRAAIDLSSLHERTLVSPASASVLGVTAASLDEIITQPLPCCVERKAKADKKEKATQASKAESTQAQAEPSDVEAADVEAIEADKSDEPNSDSTHKTDQP